MESESLHSRFLTLSATAHPDRVHSGGEPVQTAANERFAELNAAYQCLREPKARLHHLLELELGSKLENLTRLPAQAADLYFEIGRLCRSVDNFLSEKEASNAPLLKVEFFRRATEWMDQLNTQAGILQSRQAKLDAELRKLNELWLTAPPVGSPQRLSSLPMQKLEGIYREISYVTRWSGQIHERLIQLTL